MGWYVKTEQQLRDSGWTGDNRWGYFLCRNPGITVAMLVYCGMPYQ